MPVPKEIIATLSNYHLIVENESRHNEISFWIDDKRLTYQYDPVQLDLDNLRQKLRNFGATLKVSASTITTLAAPPDEAQAAPEAPKAPKAPRAPIVTNREGYTVYRSAKVIAIELAEDLKVTKGHMLVIPLNRPNTLLDMTREQFLVLFDATTEKPDAATEPVARRAASNPSPPPAADPGGGSATSNNPVNNDENDVLAYLLQRKGGVKVRVIAAALGMTLKATDATLKHMMARGTVELDDGFWHLSRPAQSVRPAQPRQPMKTGRKGDRKPRAVRVYARSRDGLPAQVGRILATMAYVTKTTGRADLTTRDVVPFLIERDQRQFSARMPGALKAGWVARGIPLPAPAMRGWHYQITPSGISAVQAAGNWMYEHDGEQTPDWLKKIA